MARRYARRRRSYPRTRRFYPRRTRRRYHRAWAPGWLLWLLIAAGVVLLVVLLLGGLHK